MIRVLCTFREHVIMMPCARTMEAVPTAMGDFYLCPLHDRQPGYTPPAMA